MNIQIIRDTITEDELREIGKEFYDTMVKGVVDIERNIIVFGGEYHMDANIVLLEDGSEQRNIWGFNVYFDKLRDSWIEYTSLINIRPLQENYDMEVSSESIRSIMKEIINSKII